MNSRVLLIIILGFTAMALVFCLTQLEIVPFERWTGPSGEARSNPHLALERWMKAGGIPYRKLKTGDVAAILAGPEKTVFIEDSAEGDSFFDWSGAGEDLTRWIEGGGRLVLAGNLPNPDLEGYLKNLGVVENRESPVNQPGNGQSSPSNGDVQKTENIYTLDLQKSFYLEGQPVPVKRITVLWAHDAIRLVTLYMGAGSLTVTGRAEFLNSPSLRDGSNADLAWELLLKPGKDGGILFFEGIPADNRFFGALLERGNPLGLAISGALLIITGFWMVIPLFGRYKPVPEFPGKALKERFLAEGRFLKKYHALDSYLESYRQVLEQRRRTMGMETPPGDFPKPRRTLGLSPFRNFLEEQKKIIRELDDLAFNRRDT